MGVLGITTRNVLLPLFLTPIGLVPWDLPVDRAGLGSELDKAEVGGPVAVLSVSGVEKEEAIFGPALT